MPRNGMRRPVENSDRVRRKTHPERRQQVPTRDPDREPERPPEAARIRHSKRAPADHWERRRKRRPGSTRKRRRECLTKTTRGGGAEGGRRPPNRTPDGRSRQGESRVTRRRSRKAARGAAERPEPATSPTGQAVRHRSGDRDAYEPTGRCEPHPRAEARGGQAHASVRWRPAARRR